ncbi:hypothetical protein D9M68_969160 [compost metagenome]
METLFGKNNNGGRLAAIFDIFILVNAGSERHADMDRDDKSKEQGGDERRIGNVLRQFGHACTCVVT